MLHVNSSDIPNGTRIIIENTNGSGKKYGLLSDNTGVFTVRDITAGADRFSISTLGNATFAGNVNAPSVLANGFMEIRSDTASLYFENAANNNYYRLKRSSNDFVIDYYNGSTTSDRLTINSSGNVGIGTTSLEGKLTIQYTSADPPTSGTTANSAIQILSNLSPPHQLNIGVVNAPSYGSYIQASDNNLAVNYSLLLQPNGGNVGIGTASPVAPLQIEKASNTTLALSNSGSVTSGTRGEIAVYNSSISTCAAIKAVVDTSGTADNVGTDLTFFTRAIGGSLTQKMVINGSGNVIIGNTAVDNPNSLTKVLEIENGGTVGVILNDSRDAPMGLENRGAVFHLTYNTNSRLVVNGASGNVGIGTTSPSEILHLNAPGTGCFIRFQNTGGSGVYIGGRSEVMEMYTNGSEKMRITSTGNVGIGTTSPTNGKVQIHTASAIAFSPTVFTSGANIRLQTGGTAAAGVTTGISMGVGGAAEAYIGAVQNASTYADIVFQTYHGAYGERMRITSGGNVGIGTTAPTAKLQVEMNASSSFHSFFQNNNVSGYGAGFQSYSGVQVYFYDTGGNIGSITSNGSNTSYNTSGSDKRLKENIEVWDENVLDKFKNLQPKTFKFIKHKQNNKTVKGYIAQNEVDNFPEAYPMIYDIDAKEDMYQFNPSGMTVYLMKAIQELKAEIEILKNK